MKVEYFSSLWNVLFGIDKQSGLESKLKKDELEVPDFIKKVKPPRMLLVLDELLNIQDYRELMMRLDTLESKEEYREMIERIQTNYLLFLKVVYPYLKK